MIDEKIKKFCKENNLREPIELLIGLTNGIDFRKKHVIYEFVKAFEEKYGEDEAPDFEEWIALKELIKQNAEFNFVTSSESLTAQRALLEYQHPKKKSIDLKATISEGSQIKPLTPREISRFKRKFDQLL